MTRRDNGEHRGPPSTSYPSSLRCTVTPLQKSPQHAKSMPLFTLHSRMSSLDSSHLIETSKHPSLTPLIKTSTSTLPTHKIRATLRYSFVKVISRFLASHETAKHPSLSPLIQTNIDVNLLQASMWTISTSHLQNLITSLWAAFPFNLPLSTGEDVLSGTL